MKKDRSAFCRGSILKATTFLILAQGLFSVSLRGQGVSPYTREQLLTQAQPLLEKAKSSPDGLALLILEKYSTSSTMLIVRTKPGQSEFHAAWDDFMIPLEGEATVMTGGELIGGKSTEPGEIRGASLKGGISHHLAPGEMLRIEAGIPHQAVIAPGKTFKYLVIKILDKK